MIETYAEFIARAAGAPPKTTDDCYTPDAIYDIVKDYALSERGFAGCKVIRPFWNGCDYQDREYPEGCVVIDNPPFSILTTVCKWFNERGIDYFLFAPALTAIGLPAPSHVLAGATIIYDNGVVVRTSFVSSRGAVIESCPVLYRRIKDYQDARRAKPVARNAVKRKVVYPTELVTSATIMRLSRYGVEYSESRCARVEYLDNTRTRVFGAGYLVEPSNIRRALADEEAAKAAKGTTEVVEYVTLSERERELIRNLRAPALPSAVRRG